MIFAMLSKYEIRSDLVDLDCALSSDKNVLQKSWWVVVIFPLTEWRNLGAISLSQEIIFENGQ
jgi:hypothetical protein